ncbi:putative Amidohydrolase 3 domain-containing protein [Seiridium cardinale]
MAQTRLNRLDPAATITILKNATLISGNGSTRYEVAVILQQDIVVAICSSGDDECDAPFRHGVVHDLSGRFVTPGLVDMHSHVGVRGVPELWASEDVTELNYGPVTPWARAVDGLKPHDRGIKLLRSGGVTTSLVLTGAKNLISGEGVVIKMKDAYSVPDLLFARPDPNTKSQRYMKMACGENPKAVFGKRGDGPGTRLGMVYALRKSFFGARSLKQEQDDWCTAAIDARTRNTLRVPYPEDFAIQTLVDVLRGDVRTNAHCYEPQDVYSIYSVADEFGFNITALHHALEAHHVLDLIQEHNTMLATFSDEWGFKKEVYEASCYMLLQAAAAGIPIALTSDHPAKNGQFLMYEGQIANHFGLAPEKVLASLTGIPAKALGIDNRVGHVERGFDADLVVWDRHPLQLGARPLTVIVDGETVVNASKRLWQKSVDTLTSTQVPSHRAQRPSKPGCAVGNQDFVITGLGADFLTTEHTDSPKAGNITLVVQDGRIGCIGETTCDRAASRAVERGADVMDIPQGYLLPGLTMITRAHGLAEILSEGSTTDGIINGEDVMNPKHAALGLSFGGAHLERASLAGITRIVTPPRSAGTLHGISATFRSSARSVLDTGAIVEDETALHFTIGHEAKGMFPSISSQVENLRFLLGEGNVSHKLYNRAARGALPVVIHTGNKDTISTIIRLKQQKPQLRLVILGGAEASLVAKDLATASIPVIMAPWMCHPWSWDTSNCLPGPPLSDQNPLSALMEAGVQVAIGNWDVRDRYVRNAIWEASWVAGSGNPRLAVDLVSRNVEDILSLPLSDHFVVYSANPFEFGASVALIFEEGAIRKCWPEVE